jgi:aspartate/methionine/tyrosine aminotransferase
LPLKALCLITFPNRRVDKSFANDLLESSRRFGLSSKDFALGLLQAEQVAAVPGDAFGESGEGFLRCCYATGMDDLKAAMDAIERYIGTLS